MTNTLALFADSVNAARGGNPEEIQAVNALWDSVVPRMPYDPDMTFEGQEPWECPDVPLDQYNRIANRYERNWV